MQGAFFSREALCQRQLTAELASAITGRSKTTGVRQSLRTYGADYKTVLRLAQPQVKAHGTGGVRRHLRLRKLSSAALHLSRS
jgi:hypothetical protein